METPGVESRGGVTVINESGQRLPMVSWEKVLKIAAKVLNKKKLKPLSFIFITSQRAQELNYTYRKKNKPARVLAFQESREILLAPELIKEKNEFVYLAIHGLLHLEGIHHQTEKERRKMEDIESKIMKDLK